MAGAEPLITVVGPTASGKTELALGLAARLDGEIISADSVQVYQHFDIGSGKPTPQELSSVPHHLISELDPTEQVDASVFAKRANALISEIRSRGKTPIVCGGTYLWVRALIYGLAPAPPKNDKIRETHQARAETEGRAALHEELKSVDPGSYARLSPNDLVRVSRALEVYELTGRPLSAFHADHGFKTPLHNAKYFGVAHTADELTERIRRRVQGMLDAGWREEVSSLIKAGYRETRAMASVGYRQVLADLDAETPFTDAELLEDVTRVTRIFARRQRTWLRDEPIVWLRPDQVAGFKPDI